MDQEVVEEDVEGVIEAVVAGELEEEVALVVVAADTLSLRMVVEALMMVMVTVNTTMATTMGMDTAVMVVAIRVMVVAADMVVGTAWGSTALSRQVMGQTGVAEDVDVEAVVVVEVIVLTEGNGTQTFTWLRPFTLLACTVVCTPVAIYNVVALL